MNTQLGSLPKDQNGISVQVPSGFQTLDSATSPITSPITASGSVQTLTKPANAVEIVLEPVTNDLKVSEEQSMGHYYTIVKGSSEVIELGRMPFLYIEGTSSDVIYFRYNIV